MGSEERPLGHLPAFGSSHSGSSAYQKIAHLATSIGCFGHLTMPNLITKNRFAFPTHNIVKIFFVLDLTACFFCKLSLVLSSWQDKSLIMLGKLFLSNAVCSCS